MARAINAEVKAGRGSPHGGGFLDIASRLPVQDIKRKLPSMYHQFRELADVDITAEPMEVGPTCHYVMGGVEVEPDTASSSLPGLFAAGEVAGGMHGSNRLGGNSLSDLLVFGRRAGSGVASYVDALGDTSPAVRESDVDAAQQRALAAERVDVLCRAQAGPTAEHEQVGQRVAAEPVRAVHAARDLARGEQAGDTGRRGVRVHFDAAHHVVTGRAHLHGFGGDVDVGQFLELVPHRRQPAADLLGRQPLGHVEEDAALR